ncbi:hypothetical protein [Flagellimonas meridianipacifica]|uniref:Cytoskeletal protein CcmA (Bactofilin family) n=1 Tax=Flagellimonas meridianipacifica TaxID=1080225 RepID=A0A2T0MHY4_9FLAO|nr:hypothetical protein [Allomuricauda pacifica]PRX57190.1 hypothetical protein CLV81_1193 [Allomuricauda pacifica]
MKILTKIKAGALQLVSFVSTLIAVLLLCFLLLAHTHDLFVKKTDLTIDLIKAADQGMQFAFTKSMAVGETLKIPLRNDFGISVEVSHGYWGVLPLRKAIAKKGKIKFEKWAFTGVTPTEHTALYLQDKQRPMVIAGNAKIIGDGYLPKLGIKPGNIRGYGYNRPQLIYGKQQQSRDKLPFLVDGVQTQIVQLSSQQHIPDGEPFDLKKNLVLKNSFKNPLKVLRGANIRLERARLSGHIMIWATQKISVEANCQLQDVVLIAPEIVIKRGFQGNLQALASRSISVGPSCILQYPSVLLVHKGQPQNQLTQANIDIGPDTDFRGMLVYHGSPSAETTYQPHITIAESAQLTGEIHCMGNLELKGSIYGTVHTQAFIALENGNSYQNHLFNGKIDALQLPVGYGGLLYENKQMNQIMKWLY